MKLKDLASYPVETVRSTDSLDKAISLMDEHGIRHLPVLDDERVLGMISDRDLFSSVGWMLAQERQVARCEDGMAGPRVVADVMSTPTITLRSDDNPIEAARLMMEHSISAIVLHGNEAMPGIVSCLDLVGYVGAIARDNGSVQHLEEPVQLLMRTNVLAIAPKASAQEAAALMLKNSLHHVPVVVDGFVLGVLSDRDVRRAFGVDQIEEELVQEAGRNYCGRASAFDVMTIHVQCAEPTLSIAKAAGLMARNRIGCLPVTRDDRLIGIITDTDILRLITHCPEHA